MTPRSVLVFTLVLGLAGPALGQDDDDFLAPLTPAPSKKKAPKRKPKPAKVKPKKTDPTDELLAPLTPVAGKAELLVTLSGSVKGARLFIDDREIGTLPTGVQQVAAGEHAVVVKRAGYADFSKKVTVSGGKLTELVASLEPVAGFVTATADVPGAEVYLNGVLVGPAPQNEMVVPPGTHEISVRKEGMQGERQRIAVRAGKEYTFAARLSAAVATSTLLAHADRPERTDLEPGERDPDSPLVIDSPPVTEPSQPLYARWYVWAGVAAVVAASTTAIVVANQGGGQSAACSVCLQADYCINAPPSCVR